MSDPALPTCVITVLKTDSTGTRLRMRLAKSFGTDQASLGDFEDLGEFDDPAAGSGGTAAFLKPLWDFTALGSANPADQVKAVRAYGEMLWHLLPSDFRAFYWSDLHNLSGLSLVIWTDALHFPWEMVWPRTPRSWRAPFGRKTSIDSLFGVTFAICRWSWQREDLPHEAISPTPFTAFAPGIAAGGLTAIIEEWRATLIQQEMDNLVLQHGADWSKPATKERVIEAMKLGAGLLHVRTHGGFATDDSHIAVDPPVDPEASLTSAWLSAAEIAALFDLEGRFLNRTFVFLNSCQSSSQRATVGVERGGRRWAHALTRAGCDAFFGHYWNVNENQATRASELFYDRLKAGKTLGAAALAVRSETLTLTVPFTVDFLGYSLVANPAQKIEFS